MKTSLKASDSVLLLIDHQSNLFSGIMSHKPEYVKNNVLALAKGASILDIPVILTVISPQTNGPMISEITGMFSDVPVIVRKHPSFNAFDEPEFVQAIKNTGRKQLVLTGLWTSMCMSFSAQEGLRQGFEVFGVMDTSGSESPDAYNMAVQRMIGAGVIPCTWMQTVSEWMDNWLHPKAGDMFTQVYCATARAILFLTRIYQRVQINFFIYFHEKIKLVPVLSGLTLANNMRAVEKIGAVKKPLVFGFEATHLHLSKIKN